MFISKVISIYPMFFYSRNGIPAFFLDKQHCVTVFFLRWNVLVPFNLRKKACRFFVFSVGWFVNAYTKLPTNKYFLKSVFSLFSAMVAKHS